MVLRPFILSAFLAISAAAADAVVHPAHVAKAELQARQTGEAGTKCSSDFMSLYGTAPTPPPEIFSYQLDHPLTDWCQYSVPSSLESMFSNYESAVSAWVGDHLTTIHALASSCPIYSIITVSPPCWTAGAGAKATVTTAGANSRSSGNAGARETGLVAAAVAAAGVLGAVAAL